MENIIDVKNIFIRFQLSNLISDESSLEFIFFSKNIELFLENSNNKIKLKKLILQMLDDSLIERFLSFLNNLNSLCELTKNYNEINSELKILRNAILKFLSIEDTIKIFVICANYIKDLDCGKKELGLNILCLIKNTLPEECLINAYVFNKSISKISKITEIKSSNECKGKDNSEENNIKAKTKISKHFMKANEEKEKDKDKDKNKNKSNINLNLKESDQKQLNPINSSNILKIKSNTITVKSILEYDKTFEGLLGGTGGFLITALDDERKRVKILALNVISDICEEKRFHNFCKNSFTYLLELIHDEEKDVRSKALESLYKITINYKILPENEVSIILNSMYDKNTQIKINLMKILSNIEFKSYFEYEKLINICIENIYFFDSRNLKKEIIQYLELLSHSISFEVFTSDHKDDLKIFIKNQNINLLSNAFIVNKLKKSKRNELGFLIPDINKDDYSYIVYLLILSKGIYYKLSLYLTLKKNYIEKNPCCLDNIVIINNNDKRETFRDILLSKLKLKETNNTIKDIKELRELSENDEDEILMTLSINTIKQLLDLDFIYPDFFIKDMIYFSKLFPTCFTSDMINEIYINLK